MQVITEGISASCQCLTASTVVWRKAESMRITQTNPHRFILTTNFPKFQLCCTIDPVNKLKSVPAPFIKTIKTEWQNKEHQEKKTWIKKGLPLIQYISHCETLWKSRLLSGEKLVIGTLTKGCFCDWLSFKSINLSRANFPPTFSGNGKTSCFNVKTTATNSLQCFQFYHYVQVCKLLYVHWIAGEDIMNKWIAYKVNVDLCIHLTLTRRSTEAFSSL